MAMAVVEARDRRGVMVGLDELSGPGLPAQPVGIAGRLQIAKVDGQCRRLAIVGQSRTVTGQDAAPMSGQRDRSLSARAFSMIGRTRSKKCCRSVGSAPLTFVVWETTGR